MKNIHANLLEFNECISSLNQQHFGGKIIAPGYNRRHLIKTGHKLYWALLCVKLHVPKFEFCAPIEVLIPSA